MNPATTFVLSLLSAPVLIVWRGYALSWLWEWFLVPLGALSVGIPAAVGITLVSSLLVSHLVPIESNKAGVRLFVSLAGPAFSLVAGWLVSLFL